MPLVAMQPGTAAAASSIGLCWMWLWQVCIRWCCWQAQRSRQVPRTFRLALSVLGHMCSQKLPGQICMARLLYLHASAAWVM